MTNEEINQAIIQKLGWWEREYTPLDLVRYYDEGSDLSYYDSLIAQGIKRILGEILLKYEGERT